MKDDLVTKYCLCYYVELARINKAYFDISYMRDACFRVMRADSNFGHMSFFPWKGDSPSFLPFDYSSYVVNRTKRSYR
jgi:hypothetical protein